MDRIIGYEPIDSGSNPDTSIRWPLRLMVRTAASQAANAEFKSRRGHYAYRNNGQFSRHSVISFRFQI